jgi:hypothetical protein
VEDVAPGIWSWTARHSEWQAGQGWDEHVRCFCVETEDRTLLLDPLVEDDDWAAVDDAVARRRLPVAVLLTQAAHARSAGAAARRYGAGVWGHAYAHEKVGGAEFHPIAHRDAAPGGARVLPFDELPGGSGTPLYLRSHAAVAIGDVFISVEGGLRIWWSSADEVEERWYRERYVTSLRRWLELPIERILVAHGPPVPGGADEIAAALERPPFAHD